MPSAAEANLRPAGNRDGKRALSERGRAAVCWLHARAPLQENVLIRLPGRDVAAIFAAGSGQQRVNELFRRCRGAQGPGLCPVHPAGGRRLAARLRRRSGRARPRAPPLSHRLRRPVEPQARPIWTRRKCLRGRPGTGIVWPVPTAGPARASGVRRPGPGQDLPGVPVQRPACRRVQVQVLRHGPARHHRLTSEWDRVLPRRRRGKDARPARISVVDPGFVVVPVDGGTPDQPHNPDPPRCPPRIPAGRRWSR